MRPESLQAASALQLGGQRVNHASPVVVKVGASGLSPSFWGRLPGEH